jgi:sugar O-acyltransferase (sialic acid O-acetyltransferase NeuD family)
MLIIGAKGFAKEVLEIVNELNQLQNVVFYDDISIDVPNQIYDQFAVIRTYEKASNYFQSIDKHFTIGIGNPLLRKKMSILFKKLGGELVSTISPNASIGSFDVKLGMGVNILPGVKISNSVVIGSGSLVYYNSIIAHDCLIGNFVEISPGATILGRCTIGSFTQIGANATILPDIKIGKNVIVGAGAVITKDVPDNSVVVGIPAKIIKTINSKEEYNE